MRITKGSLKVPTKVIIPIVALAMGIVFFYISFFQYGFWDGATHAPTKGFFPAIISVVLILVSILSLVNGLKEKGKVVEFQFENWLVPLGLVAIILASYIIGLVPAIIIFELVWLKLYERLSWKITIIVLAIVLFIVVCCFQMWLGISFPMGVILDHIIG